MKLSFQMIINAYTEEVNGRLPVDRLPKWGRKAGD